MLITLGVIGVVAALTIPGIIANANDSKYRGARQKALATIGEAVRNITVAEGIDNASSAEDFVENYLKKQLQIAKTCDNSHLRDCGIETGENKIISLSEKKMTMPRKIGDLARGMDSGSVTDVNSTSYGFIMSNGYSVNLFYNPNCLSDNKTSQHWGQDRVCINAIYDMNGLSQPNKVGKDIGFVTVIYPDIQSVAYAPDVYKQNAASATFDNAADSCHNLDVNLSVPNRDELLSMYYNGNLLGITSGPYWSAYESSAMSGWYQHFNFGNRNMCAKSDTIYVRCVRR